MTAPTWRTVSAPQLKAWIHDEAELALLDVREAGQYGENHLFFAVPVPYSALEVELPRMVPNPRTRVVLYGDSGTAAVVEASVRILERLGYTDVHLLQGGIEAWEQAGYTTFAGVNLPSKTFGELAEHAYGTPHVTAGELAAMLRDPARKVIVIDGRPVSEYRKMNIPGAVCCPNGELALRVGELAPDPETTIVVNCAGRTRSIIGAQTLINLGIPNKVYALENGTQGWYLADHELEHQSDRLYPQAIAPATLPALRDRSARLARRFALPATTSAQVSAWLSAGERSIFVCDIRTEEEHRRDHLPGLVQHAAGGQLIQATDQYIGVRKARIVLYDADGIRAPVVASWLKQLGWEVYLLPELEALADVAAPAAPRPVLQHTETLQADALPAFLEAHPGTRVLDARPSQDFRRARLPHSHWVTRATLPDQPATPADQPVLLLGPARRKLELLAQDLEAAGQRDIYQAVVNTAALQACGVPLESGAAALPDAACIDFLFFVHDRHDGNKEAARQYLAWETGLLARLDEAERSTFAPGP